MDLKSIVDALTASNIRFVLVGGLAAVAQGVPIATMDVDIVHDRSPDNVSRLMAFLRSIDAVQRRMDDKIIVPQEEDLAGLGHCLLKTRLGPLDVLGAIEQGMTYEDLVPCAVTVEFRGRPVQVLEIKTMLEMKKTSKNPKDKQRLPLLEAALCQSTAAKKGP